MPLEPDTSLPLLPILALLDAGAQFGDEIGPSMARKSAGALNPQDGLVLTALAKLERTHMVSSAWLRGAGPRRRLYAITDLGRETLRNQAPLWRDQVAGFDRLLSEEDPG